MASFYFNPVQPRDPRIPAPGLPPISSVGGLLTPEDLLNVPTSFPSTAVAQPRTPPPPTPTDPDEPRNVPPEEPFPGTPPEPPIEPLHPSTPGLNPLTGQPLTTGLGPYADQLGGYDANKLNDPNHQTLKYRAGRIMSNFPSVPGSMPDLVAALNAAGIPATQVDEDEIDFGPEIGVVDVIFNAAGGGEGWQWLPNNGGSTLPSEPSHPPTAPTEPIPPFPGEPGDTGSPEEPPLGYNPFGFTNTGDTPATFPQVGAQAGFSQSQLEETLRNLAAMQAIFARRR